MYQLQRVEKNVHEFLLSATIKPVKIEQVGTELGQAQLKLGFDFTLFFCTIKILPAMVEILPKI